MQRYSFGCVIINKDGIVCEPIGFGDDLNALTLRNVAGELQGAMVSVKWAYENGYKNIIIRHDYEGISKWFNGEWKAKNTIVKIYCEFMNEYKGKINISFEKVDAHSGDKYNEKADRLAKSALKEGSNISKGDYWVKIEGIKLQDFDIILDVIKKEENIDVKSEEQAYGKIYRIHGENKEKLVIKHFSEKENLFIQGKPEKLFTKILTYITEVVDTEQIPKIFNEYCKLQVEKNNLDNMFMNYIPHAINKLPDRVKKVLYQSVYNLNIFGEMTDYTFLVFPALRGLEGILKCILSKHKIPYSNSFDMFEQKNNNTYKLCDIYESNIGSPKKIKAVNKLYNHFFHNRHPLFHWNDPCDIIDDTRIITSTDAAHKLIKDTLQYIDEYYKIE
nr:type II toxin-antitoxin system RnlA family toxin [Clostridium polynesiense]